MSKVYHGSVEEVRNPEIRQSNRSLDYGSGFYTTTSYEQAKKWVERIESEIPTLQKIVCRQWSKTDELSRLKQECKELQHRIDESLKEAEQPQAAKHEAIAEAA